MTKKVAAASATVPAARADSPRTQPLPIPETKFKTIWQVVTPIETAGKSKTGKKSAAA